jgi:hypothetical protein
MSKEMLAVIVFGAMMLGALVLLVMTRRAAAQRREARGGREIDVGKLIVLGSAAGEGVKTHE